MKQLQLKTIGFSEPIATNSGVIASISYRDELLSILRYAASPDQPLSFEEMELALSIRGKIKALSTNGVLMLLDNEAAYLNARVKAARFLIADSAFLEMKKDIQDACA